jgi:FMN phosphatase YigB (HAD superfamily)
LTHASGGSRASTRPPAKPVAAVVALDLGNVCISLNREACAARFGYSTLADLFTANPDLLHYARLLETGKISREELIEYAATRLPLPMTPAEVEAAWGSMIGDEMPGMADIVRDMVDMGLRPVFFSDVSEVHLRLVYRKLTFLPLVRGAVVSYEVGAQKPAPAMFEAMERNYCNGGVPTLYVDDRAENIDAGRNRGWFAYHFGTVQGLRHVLLTLGQRRHSATPESGDDLGLKARDDDNAAKDSP